MDNYIEIDECVHKNKIHKIIKESFANGCLSKIDAMRYFKNELFDNELPPFQPTAFRQVNTNHPNHLEINAQEKHRILIKKIISEIELGSTKMKLKKSIINNQLFLLKKIITAKKMPYDILYYISLFIY